ncbi:MAG: hypothetical protein PF444_01190 [Bacteroidales bacterium]|jgi:hypothetical protein|nr:hypothetical protein [Bacteroidales bacterium]
MKVSKILFITFFSLIGIVLLIIPIIISNSIQETENKRSIYKSVEKELPHFNHLKVANNSCFQITDSKTDKNVLIYSFPEDSIIDEINFELAGDTLILPYQDTRAGQSIKVRCGKTISITCKVALSIEKAQDTLSINSESGEIIIRGKSYKQLNIKGTGGSFRTPKPFAVEHLNAKLDSTRLKFYNVKVNQLDAQLSHNSELTIEKAKEISISKDISSHFKEN